MAKAKQLPSGNWRIQTYKMVNGKAIRKSFTAPTKKEAEKLAMLWDLEQEEAVDQEETLQAVFEDYIRTCKAQELSPSTIKEYTSRATYSFDALLGHKYQDLKTIDVQKQIDKRAATVSAKTLRNDLSFLRASLASRKHDINFAKIKIAKKKKRKKLEMKEEWRTEIPRKSAELYGKDDDYLYLILIIYAGLRPSESHALTWGDISKKPKIVGTAKMGYISVSKAIVEGYDRAFYQKDTKTESGIRTVAVTWALIEEIQSVVPRGSDTDIIIPSNPYSDKKRWKRIKQELNLPDTMRRYDLRHLFATSLVASGATEEELQQQMGHSTSSFSHSVYVEILQEHKNTTTARFAELSAASIGELKDVPKEPQR
ncbi:MAG: site-specific integrase [Clostridia bacterium]|nr:site-specific integrase [Clostridia bacterium]